MLMQVHPETLSLFRKIAPARLLFLEGPGNDHDAVLDTLKSRGHEVVLSPPAAYLAQQGALLSTSDVVLVDLTSAKHTFLKTLEDLNATIGISNLRPRLLCFSSLRRNPHFELAVEKCGARYVRVSNLAVLLDAIDMVLAETDELQRDGPCFHVIHRFSQGDCAPGEEVSAVLLAHNGKFFQLPLPLSQRLLFNFIADHRRIALDSSQIVSGLTNDWFYRDHAANSGYRQVKKIRRPTIKVLVQRLREALASTFAEAKLRFDPRDVLRSCPAEGSKRVLYKLRGEIRWLHVSGGSR
jgi:hypothetical protein